jgi:uncharacterized membrane protein
LALIDIAVVLLSVIGLLISSYFTAISYRWIRPDEKWIPAFCRLGERTCASIVFTPRARVFGLPNSVLGQVFYAALVIGGLAGRLEGGALTLYLLASLVTVALGAYLTYSLLFLTRVPCTLCFTSHLINLVIFIMLLILR